MKVLAKYLYNRVDSLNALLDKPREKYTAGTFHQMRVEIKKLNALFDLMKYCSKDFNRKKTSQPFKLIFRQAGNIRELQLEEAFFKKYQINNSLPDYLRGLRDRRLIERDYFFKLVDKKMKSLLKKRIQELSPILSALKRKKVNKYLKQKKKCISKLLRKDTFLAGHLHELRTRLKMLSYNRRSLSLDDPLKKKDVLPSLLGQWHDLQVMFGHLQKTINTGGLQRKEIVRLEKIKVVIDAESNTLYDKIIKEIPKSEFFEANHQDDAQD